MNYPILKEVKAIEYGGKLFPNRAEAVTDKIDDILCNHLSRGTSNTSHAAAEAVVSSWAALVLAMKELKWLTR
jgi:hypothetical protein